MPLALLICIFTRTNDTHESPHVHTQGVSATSLRKSYTWLEKKHKKIYCIEIRPCGALPQFMVHSSVCQEVCISVTDVKFQLT